MQISISGKNMDTGLAFQEHAELSLNNVVEKYFSAVGCGGFFGKYVGKCGVTEKKSLACN